MKTPAITLLTLLLASALPLLAKPPAELPVPTEEQLQRVADALPSAAPVEPKTERNVLIFWRTEGYFHACIPLANQALKQLGESTGAYRAEISDDMSMFDQENLNRFDAIILNNTTRLSFENPAHLENLIAFVRSGKGLVGIHAATDNFYCCPDGATLLGGQFDGHPWNAGGTWAVKIDAPEHTINEAFGANHFEITDEIYQIKGDYSRAAYRVLLSLDMDKEQNWKVKTEQIRRDDKDFPIAWIKPYGKGRVFYCSLGHNHHIFWNPAVLRHYLAGIQYALGDLPADDSPSEP